MADALHDTTWILEGPIAVPDGVEVVIAFADGNVSGTSGCNRFRGTYRYEGQALELGPLAGTMMMCSPEAMAVERDVLARLADATRALHDTSMLTLLGADDAILLQFTAQTSAGLVGAWVVNGIHHPAREAILSTRGELTVEIADGRISGNGGCNTFHGSLVVADDGITIGPLMSTRKFCDDPDAGGGPTVMEQEAALFAALEHATGHRLEGSRLTLLRPDGGISVTLHRA
jgi:heat shock protein HslJ